MCLLTQHTLAQPQPQPLDDPPAPSRNQSLHHSRASRNGSLHKIPEEAQHKTSTQYLSPKLAARHNLHIPHLPWTPHRRRHNCRV